MKTPTLSPRRLPVRQEALALSEALALREQHVGASPAAPAAPAPAASASSLSSSTTTTELAADGGDGARLVESGAKLLYDCTTILYSTTILDDNTLPLYLYLHHHHRRVRGRRRGSWL